MRTACVHKRKEKKKKTRRHQHSSGIPRGILLPSNFFGRNYNSMLFFYTHWAPRVADDHRLTNILMIWFIFKGSDVQLVGIYY